MVNSTRTNHSFLIVKRSSIDERFFFATILCEGTNEFVGKESKLVLTIAHVLVQ